MIYCSNKRQSYEQGNTIELLKNFKVKMLFIKRIIVNARDKYAEEDLQRKAAARKRYIEGEEALQYGAQANGFSSHGFSSRII